MICYPEVPMKRMRSRLLLLILFLAAPQVHAQEPSKQEVKQKAEAELQQMTPQQIDMKIKEMGMTRQQAEAKAKEYGVDLNAYLQRRTGGGRPIPAGEVQPAQPKPDLPTAAEQVPETVKESTKPESERAADIDEVRGKRTYVGPGGLKYFGYDIFSTIPSAFEPMAVGPVDPEYLIGPEDVLRVTVWGQVEFQNELIVDKEGKIFVPTIGQFLVSGLTLQQAYEKLLKNMSRSYSGLVSQPPSVWLDVTLARLRPKRVFIMGEVDQPGGYTVSSYATVFNTLYSVGGPTLNGSLRDVRVLRGGKLVTRVDLYHYLTGSEQTNDIRVQSNDIIYVPIRGKTVSIKGEVRRPGIFELLPGENLKKLLEYAGGAKSSAYLERTQIDRILPFEERERGGLERRILDVNFRTILTSGGDYELADGDGVSIYSILDTRLNFVSIEGAVTRPGSYQLEKVQTLRDLVIEADSLLPEAYLGRADIIRTRPDFTLEAINVDLGRALAEDTSDNIALMPLDQVRIYSIHEIADKRIVTVRGHVRNPGNYAYADSLTLYDLVFKAGGLTDSIYRAQTFLPRADLLRLNQDGLTKSTIPFNLGRLLEGDSTVNRLLRPDDEIVIYEVDVAELRNKFVEVRGSVRRPGRFALTSNMDITDAILLAGGYTEDAWRLEAEVARVVPRGMGRDSLAYIRIVRVPEIRKDGKSGDPAEEATIERSFQLEHRDHIFVRPNPEYKEQGMVVLEGELQYPGQYALRVRNERLSDVIARAGGITKSAYLGGGRMERNGARFNVDFDRAIGKLQLKYDVILQPGDVIRVPARPNAVQVTGEVNNPGLLNFIEGENMWSYIDRAGGVSDSAAYALVSFPNGNMQRVSLGWFGGNPDIPDGSAIRVTRTPPPPPEGEKVDIAGTIKDVFAITASAVTILVLTNQLK